MAVARGLELPPLICDVIKTHFEPSQNQKLSTNGQQQHQCLLCAKFDSLHPSCPVERSFSELKIIKTDVRSTMGNDRLHVPPYQQILHQKNLPGVIHGECKWLTHFVSMTMTINDYCYVIVQCSVIADYKHSDTLKSSKLHGAHYCMQ